MKITVICVGGIATVTQCLLTVDCWVSVNGKLLIKSVNEMYSIC